MKAKTQNLALLTISSTTLFNFHRMFSWSKTYAFCSKSIKCENREALQGVEKTISKVCAKLESRLFLRNTERMYCKSSKFLYLFYVKKTSIALH